MNINSTNDKEIALKSYTETFLDILRQELGDQMLYKNFFANFEIKDISKIGHITIGTTNITPNSQYVIKAYESSIQKSLDETFERKCTFSFVLLDSAIKKKIKRERKEEAIENIELSNREVDKAKTFDNYVEGNFNKEAIRIAKLIVDGEEDYNPIFIYGKSGIGKTHLLNAICNEFLKKDVSVKYINANSFTRDISYFLQENDQRKLKQIRNHFDNADIVMFDDFQSYGIGNKKATIELIFNILDSRINQKRTTIICSDRPIYSLQNSFDARLISRLSMGLQLSIDEPQKADLLKILDYMIDINKMTPELWEDDAKNFIVKNHANSIRSLIGAINRLRFYNSEIVKTNSRYTLAIVNSILKDIQQVKEKVTPDVIIEYVAKYYKLSRSEILGKSRRKDVVLARHIAIWIVKKQLDLSLEQIGKFFGNRDHSTIINAVRKIEKETEQSDRTFKRTISEISNEIFKKS
ncbi:chromosomal replication initiator protein DnaA [Mycoplasma bovis]|uniref:Chromosomal replication initiator protein DnaA n=5 Tax=Mycoplasmopsis bovis TaxID=28903 RepID=A0A059XY72_MYCBV|nr:chromosomal replication initiator protein DnaA [Mycoplasmopsis bovis]AEI89716.1 chromosomal replication initiation protein [Mycoplasmopsis bovis Hubei-1]AFM51379.1 replication initiation protein [Mycoplasmopsis bovis HB0801]AIA33594.1 chromosomal replication initiation protein [Mycoplasmopsis bovis CQ-W70]AKO50237.1 chromosomal replication initiation protein [Mycoplasmopsis bovis]AMW24726.1 chromosomal replication initiation protein [Mycoplasmopsis bovis]